MPRDLRLPVLALAAWAGGLIAPAVPAHPALLLGLLVVLACASAAAPVRVRPTVVAAVCVLAAVCSVAAFRAWQAQHNPVAALAARQAQVHVVGTVSSDARTVVGAHATHQLVRLDVSWVSGRGAAYALHAPVTLLGDDGWAHVPLGTSVRVAGRLVPSAGGSGSDGSGLLLARTEPEPVRGPGFWWRASGAVRASVRASVEGRGAEERAVLPALVDGDVSVVPDALADDFRATGLTHLMAVSGTNLTLLVGFLLVVARWCGVRGRWLYAVAACGIAGFVLLARTEPSVLRAAVMGAIGLLAMSHDGRHRALRGLGGAVVVLLLIDPALARSMGFALSSAATAGILLLAPAWRDALGRWLPRWLAEAIAVPSAAQLACTPLIAAISGQVSLVAVAANLLAEPVVGPATVLGLLGGVTGLVWAPLGRLVALPAAWCVGWIVTVAHRCAAVPTAGIGWGAGPVSLVALTVLTAAIALYAPRVLRHRIAGAACCLAMVLVMLVRLPTPGWPPTGWVMAMCDVGQGDGLALEVAPGAALVVDTGPDPELMDGCLDTLHVRDIPLLVLTHFHADHVDGIAGATGGRHVGAIWTTRLQDPPAGVAAVSAAAAEAGVVPTPAPYGATVTLGDVTLQVLWPLSGSPTTGPGDGSTANAASVVFLARAHGLSLLLTGDVEPDGQRAIAEALPGLQVDVLKVPHHGSRYQDEDWLLSLHPKVALTSVGADNDYGHPAASTLDPLSQEGVQVYRTDRDGALALVAAPDGPRVVAHR